jgi:hypothetical protein
MTLTIRKLSTLCRSPKGFERAGALVDEVARGPLPSELSGHLGPSLDRLPAVVRLRNLQVQFNIASRRLNKVVLAEEWAKAFSRALHRALAYPENEGACALRRYASQAAYKAAMLHHLAINGLAASWQFPELEVWRSSSAAEAALGLLLDEPDFVIETIAQLASTGWLEPLLLMWDEPSVERVIQAIGKAEMSSPDLSLADFLELGHAAAASGGLQTQWSIASGRQAVRLWWRLSRRFPVRGVWHGLRLLKHLLETSSPRQKSTSALLSDPIPFPRWCEAILSEVLIRGDATSPPAEKGTVSELDSMLARLRPLVPSAASAGETGTWISSECAGVLLLVSTVRRMGLWRLAREPEFARFGGRRAFCFLLAAIGMTLLGEWKAGDPIEPAIALFAGIFSDEDRVGMKQFFAEADVQALVDFACGATWSEALETAAKHLIRAFAERIRGFRQASRSAAVKQFVRIRGRVLIEDERLLVVLEPNPCAVAVHISGADEPLENVEWLGERRVEFVLEGL